MKKTLFLLAISLILSSCTNKDSGSVNTEVPETPNTTAEISSLLFEELDIQISNPLDFGTLNTQSAETRIVAIRNTSNTDISFTMQPLIGAFSIAVDRCNGEVKANKSCLIGIVFKTANLYNGGYSNSLVLEKGANQISIPLIAQIQGKPHPVSGGGLPNLDISLNSAFDTLTPPTRSLSMKNTGDGIARNITAILPEEFKILINRCGVNDLYPGKTCTFVILFKNYKTQPAPGPVDFVVRTESNNSVSSFKKIDSRTLATASVSMVYTGTYTSFPANTKTAVCSGTETFTKTILSCKDQFNNTVANSFCPAPDSITYQSPAGELAAPVAITGGNSFYSCNLGESAQYLSRVSCNIPSYFPVGLSCSAQSFTGSYAVATNPVPNACDGSQTVQRPLISGSCIGSVSLVSHDDSNCASTAPQSFQSPAGNKVNTITGGSITASCLIGSSSQTYQSFACNAGRYFSPISLSGQCQSCSPGTFSGANATSCSSCGTGSYQPNSGSTSCLSCTNQPADMTAVTAINYATSGGLTSNSCPISSVSCTGGWTNPVWSTTQCKPIQLVYPRGTLHLVNSGGADGSAIGYAFEFALQVDGNVVLYSLNSGGGRSGVIWNAGTGGRGCNGSNPCRLIYQGDGNLVAYQDGFGPYWNLGPTPENYFVIHAGGVYFAY